MPSPWAPFSQTTNIETGRPTSGLEMQPPLTSAVTSRSLSMLLSSSSQMAVFSSAIVSCFNTVTISLKYTKKTTSTLSLLIIVSTLSHECVCVSLSLQASSTPLKSKYYGKMCCSIQHGGCYLCISGEPQAEGERDRQMAPPSSRCAHSAYTAPCSSADPGTSVIQQTRKLEGCGHKPAAHGYGLAARQETPDNLAAHKKSK